MAEFPGFESQEENISKPNLEDSEVGTDSGYLEDVAFKDESLLNYEISNHLNSAYNSLKKARELYLQRLRQRIKIDSKTIWDSQDFIDPAIKDPNNLPEVHVSAKHKHMNDFLTKSFLDTHRKVLDKITSLLSLLG